MADYVNEEHILEDMYQHYLKKVKADESKMHPVQQREMRKAFYAGASEVFGEMTDLAEEDEEKAFKFLDRVQKECLEFWKGVTKP